MGRKPRFEKKDFVQAALRVLALAGPAGVTVQAVARETGAPIGSVYHRFASRDVILAGLWVRIVADFQDGFLAALAEGDVERAILHTPRWVRERPREAAVLLLYRREELIAGPWPEDVKARVADLAAELDGGIMEFVMKKWGAADEGTLRRTVFALMDVPAAAVRRYLARGEIVPLEMDRLIAAAGLAALEVDL